MIDKQYHKIVEHNNINPPENVVTKDVFKPFHRILGAIFETSGIILNALLIPIAVVIMPNIAVTEPTSIILSIWYALFKFFTKMKIKKRKEK